MNEGLEPALTAEQRRIINSRAFRAEVRAYAGTGKTHTLVARVAKLIERGATPARTLVLTYSNDAVDTLKGRLPDGVRVQTIHAFGKVLAERDGTKYRIIQGTTETSLIRGVLKAEAKALKGTDHEAAKRVRGWAKDPSDTEFIAEFFALVAAGQKPKELVAEEGSDFVQLQPYLGILKRVYRRLQAAKHARGVMTFADMVRLGKKALAAGHDAGIRHLLIDEYQDTTPAQTMLIRELAKQALTLMVFGDPSQAIYGFAGARFTSLKLLVPEVKSYHLTRSFRLTQSNATHATAVLRQRDPAVPPLVGTAIKGHRPRLVRLKEASMQPQVVVEIVQQLIAGGAKAREIAILGRTKAQLREVDKALLAADLDTEALYRDRSRGPLLAVLKTLGELERIAPDLPKTKLNARLAKVVARISVVRGLSETTLAGCRRKLANALLSDKVESRLAVCMGLHLTLLGGRKVVGPDVHDELMRWLPHSRPFACAADLYKHVVGTRRNSRVRTSTIHGAKGREWEHVLVLNVVDGSLPLFHSQTPSKIEEERNLFYVAVTRARDRLFLIQAPFVASNGHQVRTFAEPSPFVSDDATRKCLGIRRFGPD